MTWRNHYQCWQEIGPIQSRQSSSYKKPGRRVVSALSRVPCSSIQVVLISWSSRKASWRHGCSARWRCFGPDNLSSSSHLKLDVSCSSLFSYSFVFLCLFLRVTGQYQSSLFVDGPGSALENQLMSLNFLFCFSPPFFFQGGLAWHHLGRTALATGRSVPVSQALAFNNSKFARPSLILFQALVEALTWLLQSASDSSEMKDGIVRQLIAVQFSVGF